MKITGTGIYIPPVIQTSEEIAPLINKTPEWIIKKSGVKERRVSSIDVDEMGAIAGLEAIGDNSPP